MDIKVQCPSCHQILRVPLEAAGRPARCPACKNVFQVPEPNDIVEQTVSHWIEEDVDELLQTEDTQWKQRLQDENSRRREEVERKTAETAALIQRVMKGGESDALDDAPGDLQPVEEDDLSALDREIGLALRGDAADDEEEAPADAAAAPDADPPAQAVAAAAPTAPAAPRPAVNGPDWEAALHQASTPRPKVAAAASASMPVAASTPPAPATAEPHVAPAADAPVHIELDDASYPTDLQPHPHIPHLVVRQVTQKGVLLAFDYRHLRHPRFRLSMPVACAFTGETNRQQLMVRPLAFMDTSKGVVRSAAEIEAGHERRLGDELLSEELLARMGVIDGLPDPFHLCMPWYVALDQTGHSLECATERRMDDAGIACTVLIPDGRYALQWLANVNGICGREYMLLNRDIEKLWRDEWLTLSERVRQRINTWVSFQPGESFRYYVNDADMPKKDEGFAGVVLTNQRLVYHKYHKHGEINFGEEAQLIVRPDGQFAGLTVKTADGAFRAARFHFSDLEKLRVATTDLGLELTVASK